VVRGGGILGTFDSGLKSRVGILETSKKRKKSYKMTKKRGKKERNDEKLKKMTRFIVFFCKSCTADSKSSFGVKMGKIA